ncbi:hypothetical protein BH747_01210 [Enterococcus villorum]|uniref:Uncharacterized protein n=1 Tax=Enterococcus villorum TaxID=112904 RepID=A0A1V8YFU6_9ENTE|nr:hypothetical protein BH747_01210 [Enterococcus villorum]OQO76656.1 hypothetical protein BH744_02275 [Enterococcus villorum]
MPINSINKSILSSFICFINIITTFILLAKKKSTSKERAIAIVQLVNEHVRNKDSFAKQAEIHKECEKQFL